MLFLQYELPYLTHKSSSTFVSIFPLRTSAPTSVPSMNYYVPQRRIDARGANNAPPWTTLSLTYSFPQVLRKIDIEPLLLNYILFTWAGFLLHCDPARAACIPFYFFEFANQLIHFLFESLDIDSFEKLWVHVATVDTHGDLQECPLVFYLYLLRHSSRQQLVLHGLLIGHNTDSHENPFLA